MIKKVKGAIFLPSGELFLDGDIEIEEQPVPLDEEFIEQTRNFKGIVEKALRQRIDIVMVEDGIHRPTGPIVESTIAEKGEGRQ